MSPAFLVEPPLVRHKLIWFCSLGSVIHLANILGIQVVITLASVFVMAMIQTFKRTRDFYRLERITF